jgi:cytochrome c biogenesis protein CcmG, thiol:disulfide interchange protein DsbE
MIDGVDRRASGDSQPIGLADSPRPAGSTTGGEELPPPDSRPRQRWRWWRGVGLAVALVAAGAGWVVTHPKSAPASNPYTLPTIPQGRVAPSFSLPRLGGGAQVALTASAGQPVVINFFASWCPNCVGELSTFAAEAHRAQGKVAFIGVDTNAPDRSTVESMISHANVGYPIGVDSSAHTSAAYQVVGLPATVFVDRSGRVIGEAFGAQSAKDLHAWVARLEAPVGS